MTVISNTGREKGRKQAAYYFTDTSLNLSNDHGGAGKHPGNSKVAKFNLWPPAPLPDLNTSLVPRATKGMAI